MQNRAMPYLWVVLILGLSLACSQHKTGRLPSIDAIPHAAITVDGHLQDWKALDAALKVADFHSPWDDTPFGQTEFRAIADSVWFYFSFQVSDSLLISVPLTQESDVASGDRVEIFLSGDASLRNYYCLEIGPYGDVLDYRAAYYRQFDDTWNLPGLAVATQVFQGGYAVEGRIPVDFLRGLSTEIPANGNFMFWMGLYRAEYNKLHTTPDPVQWITWIDPATSDPDFHLPSSFQEVRIKTP